MPEEDNTMLDRRLILGTAKIGMNNYGFSNKRPDSIKILTFASQKGIEILDTSPRYLDAEKKIGDFHRKSNTKFSIDTKVENFNTDDSSSAIWDKMYTSVCRSIEKLSIEKIHTLYLHQNDLKVISNPYIHESLSKLKNLKLIQYSGTSIYNEDELEYSLNSNHFDTIQVPCSVFNSSYLNKSKEISKDKTIIGRSLFTQGLIFNSENFETKISKNTDLIRSVLEKFKSICIEFNISPACAAFGYIIQSKDINHCIVGISSMEQLEDIEKVFISPIPNSLLLKLEQLDSKENIWFNPRNW